MFVICLPAFVVYCSKPTMIEIPSNYYDLSLPQIAYKLGTI